MHFKKPFWELFLWAVLTCRMDMAEFFWERIEDSVSAGIAASAILKGMAAMSKDPDDVLEAEKNAGKFEELAINVMDECYKMDETFAEKLIMCPSKHWGGKNVLTMASDSDNKHFIAHPCAQCVIKKIWLGGLRASNFYIILAILFPLLVFRLKFADLTTQGQTKPGRLRKLHLFYTSPATRFWTFVISYIVFLMLYSYVMLDAFGPTPSILEIIVFGWIVTMIIEEIRQSAVPSEHQTTKQHFREWYSSEWNIMDTITAVVGVLAFTLHWFPESHSWSQGFYAINCFMYYARVLRLFSFSEKLGPKMVMIRKMVFEMILFLCILLVFLMGYGVGSNVLLYPHLGFGIDSIKNTFYMPYFQIYGELFLDTIVSDGSTCDPALSICPQPHTLLPIMLGAYLLLGNVLLLNLLIAIFSSVFDEVQTNSLEVWKFELYFLVVEFEDRPVLPPPFIILEHTFLVLRWAWRNMCSNVCKKNHKKVPYLTKKMMTALRNFEKDCAANYRRKKVEKKTAQISERISQLEQSLKDLDKQTEKTSDQLQVKLQQIQQALKDISESPTKVHQSSGLTTLAETSSEQNAPSNKPSGQDISVESEHFAGTRQRLMSIDRRGSQVSLQAYNAKRRESALLSQLNEEMVRTAPPLLSISETRSDDMGSTDSKRSRRRRTKVGVHPDEKELGAG